MTLKWVDNANNESGFRVYRDKELIGELKANVTVFNDLPPGSGPYQYFVEAFNSAGASSSSTIEDEGCPS